MGDGGQYYGYTTGTNMQYRQLAFWSRHTGEDLTRYQAPDTSKYYLDYEPTYKPPSSASDWVDKGGQSHDGIEKIYPRVMKQDAAAVQRIADNWVDVYRALTDISN